MAAYADPDTIRRKGELVKMWTLFDYKTVRTVAATSYLSSRSQRQFDCAEERTRVLSFTWFSGKMETGDILVSNNDELKWQPVSPRTIDESLLTFACSKQ